MRQIDPARRTTPTVESSLPGVAVCIPSFNSAATIRRCLESVAGQTYPALTIAISDDCSADGTEAVIRQFRDPRVT